MTSTQYFQDEGLNVCYISNFIDDHSYYEQLKLLPYPANDILTYEDDDELPTSVLRLREYVEKDMSCTYNKIIIQRFSNGFSHAPHQQRSSAFPSVLLTFGMTRTLELKKIDYESITCIPLENGSICKLLSPTNELYSHAIPSEQNVKGLCIIITFQHVIPTFKKARLDSTCTPDSEPINFSPSCDGELKNFSTDSIVIRQWDLSLDTFAQVIIFRNKVRLHIRTFKQFPSGVFHPTKFGVTITPTCFADLKTKIQQLNFYSKSESFIAGNELILCMQDAETCHIQQLFSSNGYFLKTPGIRLSKDQMFTLREFIEEISDCLIKTKLCKVLPIRIAQKTCEMERHATEIESKETFLFSIMEEIKDCANSIFKCAGCIFNRSSQKNHDCIMLLVKQKFYLNQQNVLLSLNLQNIVRKLEVTCTCHFKNKNFFKEFNSIYFEKYFEDYFDSCTEI